MRMSWPNVCNDIHCLNNIYYLELWLEDPAVYKPQMS